MRPASRSALVCLILAAIPLLVLVSGCSGGSGSSTPPPPTPITPAQATAVATQMASTIVADSALIGANYCPTPPSSNIGAEDYCAITVANSEPCTGGGSVAVTGSVTGDVDFTDTGNFTGTLTAAPTNCAIPGTTLVINGEPNLTVNGTVFFFYGGVSSFALAEVGSITYETPATTGTATPQSCSTNLAIAASFEGDAQHTVKSCTLTGTACGQAINQNCI